MSRFEQKERPALDNSILNSSRKILVVDDDDSIREVCTLVLRTAGYQVETAANGADGLDRIKAADFDLVISDINMPELDGVEFYETAVKETPQMKGRFFFITGDALGQEAGAISSMGLRLLEKPFRISSLLGTVEELMRTRLSALTMGHGGMRKEGRLSFNDGCSLVLGESSIAGSVIDISPNGIRAAYIGEAILAGADVTVRVRLKGLWFEIGGRAVWTEEEAGGFVSGIEFVRPVPVSSIINLPAGQAQEAPAVRSRRSAEQ